MKGRDPDQLRDQALHDGVGWQPPRRLAYPPSDASRAEVEAFVAKLPPKPRTSRRCLCDHGLDRHPVGRCAVFGCRCTKFEAAS